MKKILVWLVVVVALVVSASGWAGADEKTPELIKDIRGAFIPPAERKMPWVANVKLGQEVGFLENICEALRSFENMNWAFRSMSRAGLKWEELGLLPLDERGSRAAFNRLGIQVAKDVLSALKMPLSVREKYEYCSDWLPDFTDGIQLMDVLLQVLENINTDPSAIESSEVGLRAAMLAELRLQVENTRKELSSGSSLSYSYIARTAGEWKFSLEEIGLTSEEKAEIQKELLKGGQ